jgi:hypothetical protein
MNVTSNAILASLGAFMVHEQRQSFFKGQLGELGIGLLLLQRLAEGRDAELEQLVIESLQSHPFSP